MENLKELKSQLIDLALKTKSGSKEWAAFAKINSLIDEEIEEIKKEGV